jgi:predicted ATPase
MIHLEKLMVLKDITCLKKGFSLEFKYPITLLVGEQGSGKSTLLRMLKDNSNLNLELSKEAYDHKYIIKHLFVKHFVISHYPSMGDTLTFKTFPLSSYSTSTFSSLLLTFSWTIK